MLYTLLIPPHLAAAWATGEVALMTGTAGSFTTLVGPTGIVGAASLVEASSVTAGVTAARCVGQ